MLNTGNFVKTALGLCLSSSVANILRIFARSLSSISAALLFSLYAICVAGTSKPISLSFDNHFTLDGAAFVIF